MKRREIEFDLLKGIGILAVILGHIVASKSGSAFRMPLFFFISGYFFRPKDTLDVIKTGWNGILVPFFKYGFIITLALILVDKAQAEIYLKDILLGTTLENDMNVTIGPLWFLPAMFWCRITCNILARKTRMINVFIISLLATTLFILLQKYSDFNVSYIPYYIPASFVGLIFYSLGCIWKTNNKRFVKRLSQPVACSLVLCAVLLHFQTKENAFDMAHLYLPLFPACILTAYLMIYLLYKMCNRLVTSRYIDSLIARFIKYCGSKSMDIFIFHSFEFTVLFPFINNYLHSLSSYVFYLAVICNIVIQIALAVLYAYIKDLYTKKCIEK